MSRVVGMLSACALVLWAMTGPASAATPFLKRSKVGKTRRLKLRLRFGGNSVLTAGSLTKTLVIRK